MILPESEVSPFDVQRSFLFGLPFGIKHTEEITEQNRRLAGLASGVEARFRQDIATFGGDVLRQTQSLFTRFLSSTQTLTTVPNTGMVKDVVRDFSRDRATILAFASQLQQLEAQWRFNSQSGFGSPVSGSAVMRGDKADP